MKPHSQNEHKQNTFEHFCKQILKNERNDYHRELNQQGEREVLFCELPPHTVERFAMWDKYFQDTYLFEIMGFEVAVADELLAEALKALPQGRLQIPPSAPTCIDKKDAGKNPALRCGIFALKQR